MRPVVVPGVNLEGMTGEEKDRALARWLFSPASGMISRDLRQAGAMWWRLELPESMHIWRAAAANLGLADNEWKDDLGDIASEAIEHAEALGL